MRPKEFFKRWGQGIRDLSPARQTVVKIMSLWGMIIGIIFAMIFLVLQGFWYMTIILFFTGVLQIVDLISSYQVYKKVKSIEEEFATLTQVNEKAEDIIPIQEGVIDEIKN